MTESHVSRHCELPGPMVVDSVIIIFVKLPLPGNVKTRLARGMIGADGAAAFYKACAERTAEVASR